MFLVCKNVQKLLQILPGQMHMAAHCSGTTHTKKKISDLCVIHIVWYFLS
jgi:hypothetical protein